MKKIIALLICLATLFSLLSCKKKNDITDENKNESTEDTVQSTGSYDKVLDVYKSIITILPSAYKDDLLEPEDYYAAQLGITESEEREIFDDLFYPSFLFFGGRGASDSDSPHHKLSLGYAKKDLNGDGTNELVLLNSDYYIVALFTLRGGKPAMLFDFADRKSGFINSDGFICVQGGSGWSVSSNTVYKLNSKSGLQTVINFGADGDDGNGNIEYYKATVGGNRIRITKTQYDKLSEQYCTDRDGTKEALGNEFCTVFDKNEVAMEMYDAVLNNKIHAVLGTGEVYFRSYLLEINGNSSPETVVQGKAVLDIDGDGIDDIVFSTSCATQIFNVILSCHGGEVTIMPFGLHEMYYLNTDGSFPWNNGDALTPLAYGEARFEFDGEEVIYKKLWGIVNDEQYNPRYYIDNTEVTKDEFDKYIEENPKKRVEFTPFTLSWEPLSEEQALAAAEEFLGVKSGEIDKDTGFRFLLIPNYGTEYCHIILKWLVENDHYSTVDEVYVNLYTGEVVRYLADRPDAKG